MFRRTQILIVAALTVAGCREPAPPDPQFVAHWMRAALGIARSERLTPPVAARLSAYGSLALYESYVADPRSNLRSLAGQLNGLWNLPRPAVQPVDAATVAAEAERVVLDSLTSAGHSSTRHMVDSLAKAQIASRRAAGVGREVSERSVAHGQAVGRAILAWAAGDGFLAARGRPWNTSVSRNRWVIASAVDPLVLQQGAAADKATRDSKSTLPQFNPGQPTEPYWGTLRTMALRNSGECAPPSPPAYSEQRGTDFWKMGREFYDSVRTLTPEKREIAQYWAESAFHWLDVIDQMVALRQVTADEAAEAYALTAVAISDALIGAWREKFRSLVVRPDVYVNRVFDAQWKPLVPSPPIPEYPAEHATLSAAAAEVLATLIGDSIPFTDSTQAKLRTFQSFATLRDEIAASRLYEGVHYVPAVANGLAQGNCVGERVLGRLRTRAGESRR
jgi:membrane-associated phospholipid phosphatase